MTTFASTSTRALRLIVVALMLALAAVVSSAPTAKAATITVTNLNDSRADSLRQAIADAASGDTIDFNVSGTIYLDSQLTVNKTLTIDGSGQTVSISGDSGGNGSGDVRVFYIAAPGVLTLTRLTVTKGTTPVIAGTALVPTNTGGGAFVEHGATLNVFNSTFEANLAQEGGGIYSAGTLRIEDSDIANNQASGGGGIVSGFDVNSQAGSLRANRVIFRDNIASNPINSSLGTGGAFQIQSSNLNPTNQLAEFTNCTFSGNQATGTTDDGGGAIMVYDGTVSLFSSTLSGNSSVTLGGGIRNQGGIVVLQNTIVAGNTASTSGPDLRGEITTFNHNLIGNSAGATFTTAPGSNDIIGQPALLGPLANNGGPTQTRALLVGSPAIDAGFTVQTTDQRGVARPQGAAADIGAFEAELGTITIVKVTIPGNNTSFDFTDTVVAPNAFSLSNGQQKTFLIVPKGTYAVTEEPNTGSFQLRLLSCVDGDPNGVPSTGDVGTQTATINLDPNETVTCTFTNSNRPLGVTLAGFDAQAQASHVLVTWETVSEMNNTGFNLYRTQSAQAPAAADLLASVPSQAPGSTQGFAYAYQDNAVTAGEAYWYWLEDVDLSGATTLHGPVSVVFTAPTAVTLSGLEAAGDGSTARPVAMALLAAVLAAGLVAWRRHNAAA